MLLISLPTEFQNWTTMAGKTFESRIIWVTPSKKSLRFEKRDGEQFLYSAGHLNDEGTRTISRIR